MTTRNGRDDLPDPESTLPRGLPRLVRDLPTTEALVQVAIAVERATLAGSSAEACARRARDVSERTEGIVRRIDRRVESAIEAFDRTAGDLVSSQADHESRVLVEVARIDRRIRALELRVAASALGGSGAALAVVELVRSLLQ